MPYYLGYLLVGSWCKEMIAFYMCDMNYYSSQYDMNYYS